MREIDIPLLHFITTEMDIASHWISASKKVH